MNRFMNQTYIFIPGRNRELSLAELRSVISLDLNNERFTIDATAKDYMLVSFKDVSEDFPLQIFKRLGGFTKLGILMPENSTLDQLIPDKKKFKFGISGYRGLERDEKLPYQLKELQKTVKRYSKEKGLSSRYIGSGKVQLSSGQIVGNRLLEDGFELILIKDKKGGISFGRTLAVQDIEMFTKVDLDKPCTDVEMGVLPVKLARMMINLANVPDGGVVWDPFCGSGTLLLQGLLLGYNMVGSDISHDAVECSQRNIEWLSENYEVGLSKYTLFTADIRKIDKKKLLDIKRTGINAVVFEPYMGPPMKRKVHPTFAEKHINLAAGLFKSAVEIAENIATSNIRLIGIMPSYLSTNGWVTARNTQLFGKKWKIESFEGTIEDLHWDRSNSIIRRNLIIATLFK